MSNIKQRCTMLCICIMLFVSSEAFAADWAGLAGDIGKYETDLAEIRKQISDVADYKTSLIIYLADNQSEAGVMKATITAAGKIDLKHVKELQQFNAKRRARKDIVELDANVNDKLPDQKEINERSTKLLRQENKSWMSHIAPYLADAFIGDLAVRKKLFELKYFEEDDPKQANLFEGWLNGTLPFTKYKEGEDGGYRQKGVSKWEATVRVEPVVILKEQGHAGVLFTGGMVYNFFPQVEPVSGDPFQVSVSDSPLSKYLKRSGLRMGAGAVFDDPKTEFLTGIGIQLRAWSLWGTYSTGNSRFSAAISLSDWDWLKKMLPVFK